MTAAWLLGLALLADAPADAAPETRAAYEQARREAGRDAGGQVALALWCERHGLEAERLKHLALAVLADPAHPTARGLLGMVAYRDQWQRPEGVARRVQQDAALSAALAEYNARREQAADTADGQWELALWCEQHGLDAEARAHLARVVRLDPKRESAWRRLGFKKHDGRWITDAQLAAAKAEAQAQEKADRHWKPLLEKWRGWLGDKARGPEAEAALASLDDPRAVPAIWAVFAGDEPGQTLAVRLLGQIDSAGASRALAALAVFSPAAEVRRTAVETLRGRDPREFADLLIGLLRPRIKYQVKPVAGPGSPGELIVEGKKANLKRRYTPPVQASLAALGLRPRDLLGYDSQGMPIFGRRELYEYYVGTAGKPSIVGAGKPGRPSAVGLYSMIVPPAANPAVAGALFSNSWMSLDPGFGNLDFGWAPYTSSGLPTIVGAPRLALALGAPIPVTQGPGGLLNEYEVFEKDTVVSVSDAVSSAQRKLQEDVQAIDSYNASVREPNERVASILEEVSGRDFDDDRAAWQDWFVDLMGYSTQAQMGSNPPTVVQDVAITGPPPVFQQVAPVGVYQRISCFGAGTLVRTLRGSEPIETLRVGDRVLSQDTTTGALAYRPVLVVHHNPPSPTFAITVAGETIVSSPFHRFWVAGRGWKMARDLQPGDVLRRLDGPAAVEAVEPGGVQPVYNLDVAEDHDFFAGAAGALVHDNTLPDLRLRPFDAAADGPGRAE